MAEAENTILINSHAPPSSNRISRSLHGSVGAAPQRDYMDCSTALCGIFLLFLPTNSGYKVSSFPLGDYWNA